MSMTHHKRKHLILKGTKGYKQLDAEHISHIICEDYLCMVHRISGEEVCVAKSLSFFESILVSHHFFRINHHILVNLMQIEQVVVEGRSRKVVMKDGAELPVSVRKWPAFKDTMHYGTLTHQNDTLAVENDTVTK